ncbi:MAG: hypothetical protein RKE49_08040 [Oceanicaulis sp.]
MSEEAEKPGVYESMVAERIDVILSDISAGLEVKLQVKDLRDLVSSLPDEGSIEEDAAEDVDKAKFSFEWFEATELPAALRRREADLAILREYGLRFSGLGEEVIKYLIKTALVAHGAVILACLSALYQSSGDFFPGILIWMMAGSVLGALLSGSGAILFAYQANEQGAQMFIMANHGWSKSSIDRWFADESHKKVRKFFMDACLFGGPIILIFQGVIAIYFLSNALIFS